MNEANGFPLYDLRVPQREDGETTFCHLEIDQRGQRVVAIENDIDEFAVVFLPLGKSLS